MYKVEKTSYGFRLTIEGDFCEEEIARVSSDVEFFRAELPEVFAGFVDAREMIAVDKATKMALTKLEVTISAMGCRRFALIIKSPVVQEQAKQVAFESGISEGERYINAIQNDNWEQLGLDWVIEGIEPAQNPSITEKQLESK